MADRFKRHRLTDDRWMRGWRFALVCALLLASVVLQCMVSGCGEPNQTGPVVPMNHVSEGGALKTSVDAGAFELWCDTAGYCWWEPANGGGN